MQSLLLASSSSYRSQLLKQLQLSFDSCSPDIDEIPLSDEKVEGYQSINAPIHIIEDENTIKIESIGSNYCGLESLASVSC